MPEKTWRILSFIPAINYISLFYIGIIDSNYVSIICAAVYGIVTFAAPSSSAFFWIVGLVHYAIAYSGIKKRIGIPQKNPIPMPVSPWRSTLYQQQKNALGYTDITISGVPERRQAIPTRKTEELGQIRVTFSTDSSHSKFFSDMQKYASVEGRPAAFVPFMTYWPTYDSMTKQQLAWYFYWRSQVRWNNYLDTDLSYIFIFVYEILSGIGWQVPQNGYEQLTKLWMGYQERFPKLNHYLSDWIFDFAQLYGLSYTLPVETDSIRLTPSTMTDLLVEQYAEAVVLKLPFSLIDVLCDYSLVNSKFYKDGNQKLMEEAIPRVVALADAALRKKTQKGILATYGPSRPKKQEYYAFRSAVCPQANKKISISVKAYSTNQKLRGYINELVRFGENTLRALIGCRGRLRGITLDDETAKLVESFLKKEYGQSESTATETTSKPTTISLDFENIESLREESDAVRTALQVNDAVTPTEKDHLTDIHEVTSIYIALSVEARKYLVDLGKSNWVCEQRQEDDDLIAEINWLAEHYLSLALLMKETNAVIVEDDFRDEVAYILENPPEIVEIMEDSKLFDVSSLPSELKEVIEFLVPEQKKALYALVAYEHPQSELDKIAEESMTMPQMILDDINDKAMQILGDLLVDSMASEPQIMEAYMAPLRESIA